MIILILQRSLKFPMIVGSCVLSIIVVRTKMSLVTVPTTLVETVVTKIIVGTTDQTMILGTKISLMVVPTTFVETLAPLIFV